MILTALEKMEKEMAEIKLRLVELESLKKENEYLRELVHHLASRPTPYISTPRPNTWWTSNTPKGCPKCGIGSDGKAYGYVCSDPSCATKVTCT